MRASAVRPPGPAEGVIAKASRVFGCGAPRRSWDAGPGPAAGVRCPEAGAASGACASKVGVAHHDLEGASDGRSHIVEICSQRAGQPASGAKRAARRDVSVPEVAQRQGRLQGRTEVVSAVHSSGADRRLWASRSASEGAAAARFRASRLAEGAAAVDAGAGGGVAVSGSGAVAVALGTCAFSVYAASSRPGQRAASAWPDGICRHRIEAPRRCRLQRAC